MGQEIERRALLNEQRIVRRYEDGTVLEETSLPVHELPLLDCYLTFVDSNLEDEEGHRLFYEDMNREEFWAAFRLLPIPLVNEWHYHVLEINPTWREL